MENWIKSADNKTEKYQLVENGEMVLSMDFINSGYSEAHCDDGNQRFIIKFEGFWRNKIVINKEKRIGKIETKNFFSNSFTIEFNQSIFQMKYRNNPLVELVIYENEQLPLIICKLISKNGVIKTDFIINENAYKISEKNILICVAWFLFKSISKENADYDVIAILN